MIDEPFAFGDSVVHRLDPRLRVAAATGFSVIVALSSRVPALAAALVTAVCLVAAARLNLLRVARRLGVVAGFLTLIWLVLPVTMTGPARWHLGSVALSANGLALALQISLKSISILAALTALVSTMGAATLGTALERLRVPKKLVYLMLMTYRYIFVLEAEYRRLLTAARVRCFRPGTNLHSYRTYAYLIGMLFVRAALRSERVVEAMKCRGFDGRFHSLAEFHKHPADRVFTALTAVTLAALALLQWGRLPAVF